MTSPDLTGNPTFISQNPNFPFSPPASQLLERVPGGLIASQNVLAQFLEDPSGRLRGDWFCYQAWLQVAVVLDNDDGVTQDEFDRVEKRFNQILDELIGWAGARPEMPNGYAVQLPAGMLKVGDQALQDIFMLTRSLTTLHDNPSIEEMTRIALKNFSDALWEYFQCIAFEIEASFDESAVTDVRDRFERGMTNPWEPGVTPDNVEHGGITGESGTGDVPVVDPPEGGGGEGGGDVPVVDLPGGSEGGGEGP